MLRLARLKGINTFNFSHAHIRMTSSYFLTGDSCGWVLDLDFARRSYADYSSADKPTSLPNVPYKHWVIGIPKSANAADVAHRYFQSLQRTKETLREESESSAYNAVLVEDWMVLIPRTQQGREDVDANGAGMMGVVWLRDKKERDGWTRFGMTKHLTYLGIPTGSVPVPGPKPTAEGLFGGS